MQHISVRSGRIEDRNILQQAFLSFDKASATLQESYRGLSSRLERLDLELAASNEALKIQLKENEAMRAHLAAILESLSTGVIVSNQHGNVVRCNRAAENMLALDRDCIIGKRLLDVMHDAKLDQECYPLTAPSGVLLSVSRVTLNHQSGPHAETIVLLQDITNVRGLEEQLQRRDRLSAMGEMVGRIAHEIRNPLGSVELFGSMLRRDLVHQPEQRSYADHICGAVETLERLLANLLMYTQPGHPRGGWYKTEPLVMDALRLAAHTITDPAIDITLQLDPEVSDLWCDAHQIKQVLVNLFFNAVQAMPNGGTITVSIQKVVKRPGQEPEVHLEVTDTGSGIDSAHRSRMFDPFFTTKDRGTGLGLAIVHAIVEQHRGRIEVESTLGEGTTFSIILPTKEPSPHGEQLWVETCVVVDP